MTQENSPQHEASPEVPTPPKKTLGQFLREAREERKLSIKILAQKTKISTTNLSNLEEDRYDLLPQKAYLMGFVKAYAKVLQLDQNDCLKRLDEVYESASLEERELKNLKKLAPSEKQPTQTAETAFPLGKVVAGAFVILILVTTLVFFSTDQQLIPESNQTEAPLEVTPQTVSAETPLRTKSQSEVEGQSEIPPETLTTEEITHSPSSQPTTPAAAAPTPTEEEEVTNTDSEKKQELRPIVGPMYSYSTLSAQEFDQFYPADRRVPLIDGQEIVFIHATEGDTWITYKVDDQEIRKFVLNQGRTLLIRGELIRLFMGNVNATKIFHNNRMVDSNSRTGVKSLIFPHEARTRFQLPLFIYKENGEVIPSSDI